jgi:hypothetical protein
MRNIDRRKWFTPIIPTTQEAEDGKSQFKANLGKVSRRPHPKKKKKKKHKQTKSKWAECIAQVVECLPVKLEALSTIPSTAKTINKCVTESQRG